MIVLTATNVMDSTQMMSTNVYYLVPNFEQITNGKLNVKLSIPVKDIDVTSITTLLATDLYKLRADITRNNDTALTYEIVAQNTIERGTAKFTATLKSIPVDEATATVKVTLVVMLSNDPSKRYTSVETSALTVTNRMVVLSQDFLDAAFTPTGLNASLFVKGSYIAFFTYKAS